MLDVAFIGSISPQEAFRDSGFSQAGSAFQRRLLDQLRAAGASLDRIYTTPPERVYPRGPLFVHGRRSTVDGFPVTTLSYVNTGALQFATLSAQIAPRIAAWGLRRRHDKHGVLLYNLDPIPGLASILGAHLARTPVVGIIADIHLPGSSRPDDLAHRIQYRVQRRALSRLDGVIALTREIAEDFAPGRPWMEMHGAVPDERLFSVPASQPAGEVVFLYAGQLAELKGIGLVLDAITLVKRNDIRLWISGRGEQEPLVRERAAGDPRIVYHGYGDYGSLLGLYARASVLINPHSTRFASARYMFPSKVIEYMATGKPVLSTKSAAVERDYTDRLKLVDDDPRALAAAMDEVAQWSPEERERLGMAGRDFVASERTWPVQGRRIMNFLESVFERRPQNRGDLPG